MTGRHQGPNTHGATASESLETFVHHRPLIFAIAYRMLGSVTDAEDIVQESWLRWQGVVAAGEVAVRSPKDFLAAVATRLCIDQLRLARVQRESYIGPWLPEPLETSGANDPLLHAERADSLSMALLVVLERLTPVERAIFLLHDVFAYPYGEIAPIVGKSETTCRQVARRARTRIAAGRPRVRATADAQERLTHTFARACAEGDLAALLTTLGNDITIWADGGGNARAARKPIHGKHQAAHYLLGILNFAPAGATARPTLVNGAPAFVVQVADKPYSVLTLEIVDEHIVAIYLVVNPEKFHGVKHGPQGSEASDIA